MKKRKKWWKAKATEQRMKKNKRSETKQGSNTKNEAEVKKGVKNVEKSNKEDFWRIWRRKKLRRRNQEK